MNPLAKTWTAAVLTAAALLSLPVADATAREVLVPNLESSSVSAFDSRTGQLLPPIDIGGPASYGSVAISPDGSRAYVGRKDSKDVVAIDLRTGRLVGSPIPIGEIPTAIAITPDGRRAYVVDSTGSELEPAETITVLDTQTGSVVGGPIKVGRAPSDVAIAPDGSKAYVVNQFSNTVTVLDTGTNAALGEPITIVEQTTDIAISPDGSRAYVTSQISDVVSAIDTHTDRVVGESPKLIGGSFPIAISPDGGRAYVASLNESFLSVVDVRAGQLLPGVSGIEAPEFVAIAPDGRTVYLAGSEATNVAALDAGTSQLRVPIPVGKGAAGIAVVPDQPPAASFTVARARPGVPVGFDASGSKDPDGAVSTYAWDFGDRRGATAGKPGTSHVYRAPGAYRATLTLTDDEGCSTAFVFTGRTAYCNGSAVATATEPVTVAYPGVRVGCPKAAGRGGCRFALTAVAKRRGGGLRAQSAVSRTKLKAGHSAIVSLKPKKAFAKKLAVARKVLVAETRTIGPRRATRLRRLRIVR
jgi:DNA-binding beta-propeller fold protein YncE